MGRKPRWYKGQLVRENYGGFWYGTESGKVWKQEGKWVDKQMHDEVTDNERAEQIARRMSRITGSGR